LRSTSAIALTALVVAMSGCSENGFSEVRRTDYFQQDRRNAVDLLIIVDNSCSMVEEQDALARNFHALIDTFGGAEVDWQIAVATTDTESARFRGRLVGGDDEIVLRAPAGEVDRVEYRRDWGLEKGVALSFPADVSGEFRSTWNDSGANWCPAATEYATGLKGTPGARNPGCGGEAPFTPTPAADAGLRAPHAGDLVVSEFLSMGPQTEALPDSECEWIEITSLTPDTLDLSVLEISDLGNNKIGPGAAASFPGGATLEPYGVLVVARDAAACGIPNVDYAFANGFALNDDVLTIVPTTPGAEEIFIENVAQGTTGTGIEMGLEAARLTFLGHPLSPPVDEAGVRPDDIAYYTEANGAWLRDGASLAVLFVTDENDLSPYPVDAYVRWFNGLKGDDGHRDEDLVTLSGVVADRVPDNPDLPSCESANGVAWYGLRYIDAANITGGLVESICEEDWTPIVTRLGLTLSGLDLSFELSRWPRLDTLRVGLYSTDASDSLEQELIIDQDFTYEVACNRIVFAEDQVPPSEWYVVADYVAYPPDVVPEGADPECAR